MILVDRYKRQIAALLLMASATGLLPPVDIFGGEVNPTAPSFDGNGLPSSPDPTTTVTDGTNITKAEYDAINTNLITAINNLQHLNVSALGGIEFNGGGTVVTDPAGVDTTNKAAAANQTFLASDNASYVGLKNLLTEGDLTTTGGLLGALTALSTQLATFNSGITGLTGATGHDYQAKLKELTQYIDAVAVHIGMKKELDTLVDSIGVENGGITPAKLTAANGTLADGSTSRYATTAIHVSENEGSDIPKDKYWVEKEFYDTLKEELADASDIAHKAHPDGLFVTQTLVNTPVLGTYKIAGAATNGADDVTMDSTAAISATVQKATIAADTGIVTKVPYVEPTGTDTDYSDLNELTTALNNLTTAYEDFIDEADSGTGFYAEQVQLGEVEIKLALAMGGFPVADSNNSTKSLSTILGELTGLSEASDMFIPDTNDTNPSTEKLANENKVFLYTRKATADEITANSVTLATGEVIAKQYATSAVVDANTLIATTKEKADDITLYIEHTGVAIVDGDFVALSSLSADTNYFITPAVKESATHIGDWTPGGALSGLPETVGQYLTMEDASAHILAVNDLITEYLKYDGKDEDLAELAGETLKAEVDLALADDVLKDNVKAISTTIKNIAKSFNDGEKDEKDDAHLALLRLMTHLGFIKHTPGVTTPAPTDPKTEFGYEHSLLKRSDDPDSAVIFTDGAALRSASTASFDYTTASYVGQDIPTFSTPANLRTYHNVSILSGYDLPNETGADGAKTAVTWVTPEVNDALFDAAKIAYEKIDAYLGDNGEIDNNAEYDALSASDFEDIANDLQEALDEYDNDLAVAGRSATLLTKFGELFTKVHGTSDTTPTPAADDLGAADYLQLANADGTVQRKLLDTSIALSDEGIFAIIKEATDSTPEEKKLMINHLVSGDPLDTAPTHWVTPEEVDALELPLTTATTLFNLLGNIVDYTDPDATDIKNFATGGASGEAVPLPDGEAKTELIALTQFLSGEDGDATKYDISQIATDLGTATGNFETAIAKTIVPEADYVTARATLRTAVWGDLASNGTQDTPLATSVRGLVKTALITNEEGIEEKIAYLDKNAATTASSTSGPLFLSADKGLTYLEYNPTLKQLENKGLIDHTVSDTEWISQDDLNTYNIAIEVAEKVLNDSAPTVKIGETASDKIEETQLLKITDPNLVTVYNEVTFEPTFLESIKTASYLTDVKTTLDTAKTTFTAACQAGLHTDVQPAKDAYDAFIGVYGTANAGVTGSDPAKNGYVTAAIDDSGTADKNEAGEGILAAFYKTADGYFPVGVHQSEDGLLNVTKNALINEEAISVENGTVAAGNVITNYVTAAEIKTVSNALLVVDAVLATGDVAIIGELIENDQYLADIQSTLTSAITTFNDAKKPSKSAAYKAAYGALSSRIATPDDVVNGQGTAATDLNTALDAVTGSDAPAPSPLVKTVSVSATGEVTLDPSGAVKISEDGKSSGGTEFSGSEKWITQAMLTNLDTAVKAVYNLVQKASTNLDSDEAKKHIEGYLQNPGTNATDGYFSTVKELTDLQAAIDGFIVKTYTKPTAAKMHEYVAELEKVLYGTSGVVGGIDDELDSGLSSLDGNEDALSLAILTEMEKNNQTLPVNLKVLDATYASDNDVLNQVAKARALLDADDDNRLTSDTPSDVGSPTGPNDLLAEELYDLTVDIAENMSTLEVTAESPEVALHDLYLTAKDILVYEDPDDSTKTKDVAADDLAGSKTATSDYWLPSKQLEDIQEAIAEAAEIFDKEYSSAATFEKEVAKAMEELEEVNAYEPQPGTLDPNAANALLAAKSSLLDSINRAAHLRGDLAYMEDGTQNPNTAIDPTVTIVDSKLLGTDVLMAHRWTSTMERNKLLSAMNAALGTYNSGKSVTENYNSAITSLDTSIDTFESNAKPGVKEDYELYVKSLAVYVDTMTNGNTGYPATPSVNFDVEKPIPAIDDIQSATNGAGTLPTDYWATAENIKTISDINTAATNILKNEANILEGKIELTLEELKAEYAKIPPAFEAFYGRKIDDGTAISGAVAHIQAGTKGFVTKKIEDAITTAKSTIEGLYFVGSAKDVITNQEYFTLKNFDPTDTTLAATIIVVSSMDDGADITPPEKAGTTATWVPVSYVKSYADAVESAELALKNYNDATGTISEEILKALDTNVLALETAAKNLVDNTKAVSTTLSPEAAALQTAKKELSDALVEANALIGRVYTPSDDAIVEDTTGTGGKPAGMQTNTGLEVSDNSIKLIGNSISGYGTEFTADPVQNWVPRTNFETFERAITSAIASKNSANATADSLINAEANLKAAAERIIATAKLKGPGEKEKFDEQKLILQGLIDKANLMRYGATSDADIDAYTAAWGEPISTTDNGNGKKIAYPLMLSNRNGTDVSKEAYWASAIAYNKFINAITVAERVIGDPLSNIKSIEAQIKALGDSRTGAINSILVYGKPRKGTSSTEAAASNLMKNALKVELDKANALKKTKTSDKGGRDVTEGTPWVSSLEGLTGFTTDNKLPITYLSEAITVAQDIYADEASDSVAFSDAKNDLIVAITGFNYAFENKNSDGTTSGNAPNIFGGDHSDPDPANKIGEDGTANAIADAKVIFNTSYNAIDQAFKEIKPLDLVELNETRDTVVYDTPQKVIDKNEAIAKADGLKAGDKYADSTKKDGATMDTAYNIMAEALADALEMRDKDEIPTVAELTNGVTDATLTTGAGALGVLNAAYASFNVPANVFEVGSATTTPADPYKKIGDLIVELLTEDDSPLVVPYHAVTDFDTLTDPATVAGATIDSGLATYLANVLTELINDSTLKVVVAEGSASVGTAATDTENANYSGFTVKISDTEPTPNVLYTIGESVATPGKEATLYVEIDQPKTNAATKMDVLRAASILYTANEDTTKPNGFTLNSTTSAAIADAQEELKTQLEKLLTDANFVLNTATSDPINGMKVSVVEQSGTVTTTTPNTPINFTVSIKSPIAFSPVAMMSVSDIESKINETFTPSHYTVEFKEAFIATPIATTDDTTAVGKAKSAIEDTTNAAAIIAIDKTKQYTQLTADQAILNKVTKILDNTPGAEEVRAAVIASGSGFAIPTYDFVIRLSKGLVTVDSTAMQVTGLIAPATAQTMNLITVDDGFEVAPVYDNYFDFYDNDDYELELEYEYNSEFEEEYLVEDNYYYDDNYSVEYFDNYDNNYDSNYGDDSYYYDDSNGYDDGFENDYFEEPGMYDFDNIPEFEEELILKKNTFEKIASIFNRFIKR